MNHLDLVSEFPFVDVDGDLKTLTDLVKVLRVVRETPLKIGLRGRVLGGSNGVVRAILVRGRAEIHYGTLAIGVHVVHGGHLTLESVEVSRDPGKCTSLLNEGTVIAHTCKFDGCTVTTKDRGTIRMKDCVIHVDSGQTGMNVFGRGSTAFLAGCRFHANQGRAAYICNGGAMTLEDCVTDHDADALYVKAEGRISIVGRSSVRVEACGHDDSSGPAFISVVAQ